MECQQTLAPPRSIELVSKIPREKPLYDPLNGVFQVLAALSGLIVFFPLLLFTILLIKLTSKGPALYRGERAGKDLKNFKIFKFRSLANGAEEGIGSRLLRKRDPYYTLLGRFLRKTKLDELPQLINVLRGEMNLVGPRPIRPVFLEDSLRSIPGYGERFLVKPGITGLAQIKGGYYTLPKNKLRYDLIYIKNRSFFLDLKIIFLTLLRLFSRWVTTGSLLLLAFLFVSFLPHESLGYVSMFGIRLKGIFFLLLALGLYFLYAGGPAKKLCIYRTPLDKPMVLFLFFALLSLAFSPAPFAAFRGALYYVGTGFMIPILIVNSRMNQSSYRGTVKAIALVTTGVAALGILELFVLRDHAVILGRIFQGLSSAGGAMEGYRRVSSTMANPVVLASYLLLGLPLIANEMVHARGYFQRRCWKACWLTCTVGVFLTTSRLGILVLLLTSIIYFRRYSRFLLNQFSVVFFCLLMAVILLGGERFSVHHGFSQIVSKGPYFQSWLEELTLMEKLIGVGSRSSVPLLEAGRKGLFMGANMHSRLILENGLLGWGAMMILLGTLLTVLYRGSKKMGDSYKRGLLWALFCSFLGYVLCMFAVPTFDSITLQVFFWGLVGLALWLLIHVGGHYWGMIYFWKFGDDSEREGRAEMERLQKAPLARVLSKITSHFRIPPSGHL